MEPLSIAYVAPVLLPSFRELTMYIRMISDFFHPGFGGVESHIYMLSANLIRRGHKVRTLNHDDLLLIHGTIELEGYCDYSWSLSRPRRSSLATSLP